MFRGRFFIFLACLIGVGLSACRPAPAQLTVLAGQGLRRAMDDCVQVFEKRHGVDVVVVYAGSETLFATMKSAGKGDVFVPGSLAAIQKAGDLVTRHELVAYHLPVMAVVNGTRGKALASFDDLARPGVKLGIANKEMAALGGTSERIIAASPLGPQIAANVILKAQTVNVLLDHLAARDLDAAIIWSDMLQWRPVPDLRAVPIPRSILVREEIHAAVLRQAANPGLAEKFVDFMAARGPIFFARHGFGVR